MLSRHLGIAALLVLNLSGLFYSCKKDSTTSVEGESTNGSVVTVKAAGILNGVNLQPSYYNNGNPVIDWALMKQQTKIKTVRIEIEPGFETQAKNWISGAVGNGFSVIATYHKYTVLGSDNVSDLNAAANWWVANYTQLSKAGAFTINLINEWGSHNLSANAYASAYNTAIETVRKVYSGKIIIDIPGWGQETAVAAAAAKGYNGGIKIKDTNYILSAHIYPGAWNQAKNRYVNTSDIDDLLSAGVPCIIGEFGNAGGSGANWSAIVDYAKSKGLAVLGWCWNGDGNDMNMVAPSWATNATATAFSLNNYFNVVYDKL